MGQDTKSRRGFLKETAAALPIISAAGATARADQLNSEDAESPAAESPAAESPAADGPFQPEAYWRDRLKALEDGKRYGWFVDSRRCIGCHACEVSRKSENDVPLGNYIHQTFYEDVGEYPKVARLFMPMSCQHCEDAPCIKACPCGALQKESGGTVAVDYNICCGAGTCVEVCPYGAVYLDPVAKQAIKCHNCYHRVELEMEPACVATCPAEALYFGDLNDDDAKISVAMKEAETAAGSLTQLREEKKTKPRVWFAGEAPSKIEHKVPVEGESFGPEAYSIFNWKTQPGHNAE